MANAADEMPQPYETVSRHFLRRTARAREAWLEAENPGNQYAVKPYGRGPYRYRVVKL